MSTEKLIELGEKLIQEFGIKSRTDTLSKWMIHYLAELFQKYNNSSESCEKITLSLEIKDVILRLWELRYGLVHNASNIKNIEPLILTLKKLNLENEEIFYSDLLNCRDNQDSKKNNTPDYWYHQALMVDKASRFLIRNALLHGYESSGVDDQELVEILNELEMSNTWEVLLSEFNSEEKKKDKNLGEIRKNISQIEFVISSLIDLRNNYNNLLEDFI